ncbi:MAG: S8 family serine peptidase [Polyangiaceae bacterium]
MTRRARPPWDFDYRPILPPDPGRSGACDLVIALGDRAPLDRAQDTFARAAAEVTVEEVLAIAPLFWLRVRGPSAVEPARVAEIAAALGSVRYVASARHGSQAWAPSFVASPQHAARATGWSVREPGAGDDPSGAAAWFLASEGGGVSVRRDVTGTGAGTRLAVIDDDAADAEMLGLDAEIPILIERTTRAQKHGALMVAWASGAPRAEPPFRGVAPDASPRLYVIPKPGDDVLSMPLALVRAVADGADVIVCATYLEGASGPLLDDALAFAERLGRGGRGCVVVMPTGRQTSSPPGSVHASFALSFGDPAADPRVICVGPAARGGGWFFYRDRRKLARPFGNRGPAVRLLAPGDDLPYPLGGAPRLCHAESSGAAAVAAGVALLVLANNPELRARDVHAILERTAEPIAPEADARWAPFADAHDTLPTGRDPDGHSAKHGYGAVCAERACLCAACPVAFALARIGETSAAASFRAMRRREPDVGAAFSRDLGSRIVRALLSDARLDHAARAIARHVRLLAADPRRALDFPAGALARQVALLLRGVLEIEADPLPEALRREASALLVRLAAAPHVEEAWLRLATRLFSPTAAPVPDS